MSRHRDTALTIAVAVPLAFSLLILRAPIYPLSVLSGALGTILLEAVLLRDRDRVQAVWRRRNAQVGAVVGGALLVIVGVALVGTDVLVVVLSGLVTYLCILVVVSIRERSSNS